MPPEWLEPMDPLRNTRKRCRAVASALATVPVQPAVLEFDFMHPDSLSDKFMTSTALTRKPCFDIKLWKDYDTSTPALQEEHLEKWQKVLSGEQLFHNSSFQ